ncbi:MAG: pantoate--beta-alanine ligase [Bauldia sp.]|uniref:pantoate--beta-alanine ligase n=1 Tax=Bauldia sp. TaxID=2575872 RepID=UPI001DFD453D|nr:pantoate--beta-alanine ligase [Bauldia sp.]MCB1495745.1 pantoate--beta-alanine ligase [Bauldia sp.]
MTLNAPASPRIDPTVDRARLRSFEWRSKGLTSALVPTMGALHEGHLALVRAAAKRADTVVVSIFVNPTQFGPAEDFSSYPRDHAGDLAKLAELGVDAVFMPSTEEMYPEGFATTVSLEGPALGLEADFRPTHFQGVATVVAKLLLATQPDIAIFGEKDYQQLLVIRRMVTDLGIPVAIEGLPTVREPDGLALSSRNAYLSEAERATAPLLQATLRAVAGAVLAGDDPATALATARDTLAAGGFAVDYVELRNADTLAPVADPACEPLRLLAAATLGRTRLIDNIAV